MKLNDPKATNAVEQLQLQVKKIYVNRFLIIVKK